MIMTKENKRTEPAVDNEPYLLEDLKDPEFTAEYLNAAIEEFYQDGDIKSFNRILGYIIKGGNLTQVSRDTQISRQQLYRMISGECESSLKKTFTVLNALGYRFQIIPIEKSA
jgi:probable addiction module antidote protein